MPSHQTRGAQSIGRWYRLNVTDSGLGEADPQDVPLGLQLSDALELDPELAILRGRELLERVDRRPSALTAVLRLSRGWRYGSGVVRGIDVSPPDWD